MSHVRSIVVFAMALLLNYVLSQDGICSDRCPPIVNGVPVPSLCTGDTTPKLALDISYTACLPDSSALSPFDDFIPGNLATSDSGGNDRSTTFSLRDFAKPGHVTVVANVYVGCNAGRRESGVYAHVAQRFYDQYGSRVTFLNSLKGGANCEIFERIYRQDLNNFYPRSSVVPNDMPLTVVDLDFDLRDLYFTTPYDHPSYVVLDQDLRVRHKFVGPCCGYQLLSDCTLKRALSLDDRLTAAIEEVLKEQSEKEEVIREEDLSDESFASSSTEVEVSISSSTPMDGDCGFDGFFSEWSDCSKTCGTTPGIQFRYRTQQMESCPDSPVKVRECTPAQVSCEKTCVPEFGSSPKLKVVTEGLNDPRDVAFHPTPGLHLGQFSEGRIFYPYDEEADEAWIVNGGNHSVTIVSSLGIPEHQTTLNRRDRGYYHYSIEATALAFNSVGNSGREADRDSFNYWAVCNDNVNTYLDTKEPNYFMGPTLYDSDPRNRNTVNRLGEACAPEDSPCFFNHADMLHEAPACIGIVHDPEIRTAYGNVYWAIDTTGNRFNGQLVRFDFQQPHGPGSMDHSIASVRRYPNVELKRGGHGVHHGMAVHESRRTLFIVDGDGKQGKVLQVQMDTGTFARTARDEYPIYSNRLPSFEYSIFECVQQSILISDLESPSGLALSRNGERLFVAEHNTGKIHAYDSLTGEWLSTLKTEYGSIGGMAFAPSSGYLYFVDRKENSLIAVIPEEKCSSSSSSFSSVFAAQLSEAQAKVGPFSLIVDEEECTVNPEVPDTALFDQVHDASGYASHDTNVQADAGMNANAVLLANRTDCEYDSDLNFDELLLGGYFCHPCLPGGDPCDGSGICTNVQWRGYTCDNEFTLMLSPSDRKTMILGRSDGTIVNPSTITLRLGTTYTFTVGPGLIVTARTATYDLWPMNDDNVCSCATMGPLVLTTAEDDSEEALFLHGSFEQTGVAVIKLALGQNKEDVAQEEGNKENEVFLSDELPPSSSSSSVSNTLFSTILFFFLP